MACPRPSAPMPPSRLESEWGSLVTVGEALCSCDPEELCIALLRHQARWSVDPIALGPRRLRPLTHRVRSALRCMGALRLAEPEPSDGLVVLPWESFRPLGSPGALERRLGAAQMPLDAAPSAARALGACGGPAGSAPSPEVVRMLRDAGSDAPWGPAALRRSLGGWGDEPWGRVLARPLWVPRGQPPADALQVAAALFWALTRRGFAPRRGPTALAPSEAASAAPRPGPEAVRRQPRAPDGEDAFARLLNYHAWLGALRAQVESARLLEVL